MMWNILYSKGYRAELNKKGRDKRKEGIILKEGA
jgi:hypothetical protein